MLKRWRGGARDKRRDGEAEGREGGRAGGGVTAGALCEGQTTHGSVFIRWHLCARGAGAARALSRITAISTYYPSCLSAARPCGHAPALGRLNGPLWAEREGQRGDREREGGGGRQEVGPCDAFRALGRSSPTVGCRFTAGEPEPLQAWLSDIPVMAYHVSASYF